MENIFHQIYRENIWSDPSSRSGTGSNLAQTQRIRVVLPEILEKYGVKSFVDIPCGDFFWMKEIKPTLDRILTSYIGGDIVEELVKANTAQYSNGKFKFDCLDIQHSPLPMVDLLFCRDCLVHFSYRDIFAAIRNIKKSRNKYLLTTTFPGRRNRDIITGAWFPINLEKFPFYFPKPLMRIEEECTEYDRAYIDKAMALWEIDTISISRFRFVLFMLAGVRRLLSLKRRWTEKGSQK